MQSRVHPTYKTKYRVASALEAERLQVEHVTEQRELGVCAAERFFERGERRAVMRHGARPCRVLRGR